MIMKKYGWGQGQVTLSARQVSVIECSGQHTLVLRQSKCIANAIYYSLTINENIRIYKILVRTSQKCSLKGEEYISVLTACIPQVTEFENSVKLHSFVYDIQMWVDLVARVRNQQTSDWYICRTLLDK